MSIGIFSFFSGSGFLDLGFEKSGYKVRFVNEFFSPFLEAYKYSREKMNIDISNVSFVNDSVEKLKLNEELSDKFQYSKTHDKYTGFIGGPPCPDFSIGGKNRGKDGENGKLSAVYIDLILQFQPDFFLFENVKGLWRTKKHRAFYEGLKLRLEAGGYVLHEKLINSLEYGVAQDRERIILVGFKADLNTGHIQAFDWESGVIYTSTVKSNLHWPELNTFKLDSKLDRCDNIPCELTVQHWFMKNEVHNHPNRHHCFTPKAGIVKFRSIEEGDVSKKSYKRLHRWRYSPTACYGNNEVHLHPYKERRLNVAEVLAIQSLPKEFVLPPAMTLTNMFKTIGNGVPFLAAKGLALSIRTFLENLDVENYSIEHNQCNQRIAS